MAIIFRQQEPDRVIREGYKNWSLRLMLSKILQLGSFTVGEKKVGGQIIKEAVFDFDKKEFVDSITGKTGGDVILSTIPEE